MLGITVSTSDSKAVYDTESGKIAISEKVSVYEITAGSLADGSLEEGDVLVSVISNGETMQLSRQHHVIDLMISARVGDVLTFNIIRAGTEMTVSVTVTEDCLTAY